MHHLALELAKATQISVNYKFSAVVALAAGILILIFPKILNYIIAAYLIYIGLVGLFNLHI
jgi:hypothetical protein